ncbi:MAG: response regulator, partial [Phycisphaerales bacterium]|nr:response regulator [Phycisphaerales bacterium]
RLIAHFLERAGARFDLVTNGREAVDRTMAAFGAGQPYDIVLMDMMMPVMGGDAAVRELRARHYLGLIVALTANAMADDRDRCLAIGCDAFQAKPIDRNRLLECCRDLLERRGERRTSPRPLLD